MDIICIYFCLIETNSIELPVSVSQGLFEPTTYSFPLNTVFEESIWG